MNTRSRFYARRMMFAERRQLLGLLKEAVWGAYVDRGPNPDGRVRSFVAREAADANAEVYYVARSMAHWANMATR